jgi:Aminotransferase class-III
MTMSKTLGGGLPLAAVATTAKIEEALHDRHFTFYTSHVSDPLTTEVGLAVLKVIADEHLVERANEMGTYLRSSLEQLQQRHEAIGDVRGLGLLLGVELVQDRKSRAPAHRLSSSISRVAAKPIISRRNVASEPFSSSSRSAILSSVIVVVSRSELCVATQPYRRPPRWPPLWISSPPPPDSRRSLRRATYPQLLHHSAGHDPRHLAVAKIRLYAERSCPSRNGFSKCGAVHVSKTRLDGETVSYVRTLWPMFPTLISADRGDSYPRGVTYPVIDLARGGQMRVIDLSQLEQWCSKLLGCRWS